MNHTPQPARPAAPDAAAKSRVVWIIEDDPQFSDLLAFHLRPAGYHPVQHYRGRDAIAAARTLRPSLITLDILLPDLDGWNVLQEIKSVPFMQRVPVLVISILERAELGPDCGPTAFLRKPTPRAELIATIERLAPAPGAPTRVLLVDDDPLIGELIGAMLPSPRFALQTVTSARQAAAALNASLPDLILLDLVMPHVSGFEFLQTLRADPRTRHLPVLVLTAKHLSPQEQHDLSQAAQVVLTKETFTPDRLITKVRYLERVGALTGLPAVSTSPEDAPAVDVDTTQFRDDFLAEARARLSCLSASLEPGQRSEDADSIVSAVRAAHTLKGAAAMMGYPELGDLAAQAERLLVGAMDGTLALDLPRLAALRDLHRRMERMVESLD